jgi:uncharacterized membrane protein YkvA (DUF1232 family)
MGFSLNLKARAGRIERELYALYIAYRDPRTPWYGRFVTALVVGYAFSPIDLIPDFIPILGYLDDLILLPLGVYIAVHVIPKPVLDEARSNAEDRIAQGKPVSLAGAIAIVVIWLLIFTWAVALLIPRPAR